MVAGAVAGAKLAKAAKALKFAKFFLTAGTMALSVLAYGFTFFGFAFAIGLVSMLFIHELGHVIALRIQKLKASWPVFIPFLGALIFVPNFGDKKKEAFTGYGGPLLGSVAAFACFGLWAIWPGRPEILLLVSYIGVFLNLFNLIPVRPLDGGRILHVVGSWISYIGFAIILGLAIWLQDIVLFAVLLFCLTDLKLPKWAAVGVGLTLAGFVVTALVQWFAALDTATHVLRDSILIAVFFPLALLWVCVYVKDAFRKNIPWRPPKTDEGVPMRTRLLWLSLYLVLAAALIATLAIQMPLLPESVQ